MNFTVDFNSPWYLLMLLLLPVIWVVSFRSLSGLGNFRRLLAITLRTTVLFLVIAAIADIQFGRTSDRLTVIYLLDQSLSIPESQRKEMVEFVNAAIREHREGEDRAGVVVFGREASIEIPPFDDDVQIPDKIEALTDPEYTNLADAMKLAQASFREDSAKRIVIVSDGNENLGNAVEQALAMVESAGVSIDVRPVRFSARAEVSVEKVTLPSDLRKGQPFDLRVVVNNSAVPTKDDPGIVKGQLVILQTTDDQPQILSQQPVELEPGKRVFSLRQQIDQPAFYTYEAQFIPDDKRDDSMPQNNRATAFSHVRGSGQVLLIEDQENKGEHAFLAERLRNENLEVTVRASDQLFTSVAELQPYDTVILANVPRSSGADADSISYFSDEQITMLVRNTEVLGCGLLMLGGPNSFGAGGWTNTELEKAMPVNFQLKNLKVMPQGALAIVIDRSGSMQGDKLEMAKAAAIQAIKVLGDQDSVAVYAFDSQASMIVAMTRVGALKSAEVRIDRMGAGGGTNMKPGVDMGYRALLKTQAAVKHMIVLSDGKTEGDGYEKLANEMYKASITTTTVAVGADADNKLMKGIAASGGGKFYLARNPNALPRIFMKEARRVARPLVYERSEGFQPAVRFPHEMIGGISGDLPPITGYVMTSAKDNPLVEVALTSPLPAGEDAPILASWTFGLGRVAAFTSDAGTRWATPWTKWENYDKFMSQMVRWSMRPLGDQGKFSVASDVVEGKLRVVVTALDKDDEFVNLLNIEGVALGPDLKSHQLKMAQTAPGRYVGHMDVDQAGSYNVMLSPGAGHSPILSGANVAYSPEFGGQPSNETLLATLASFSPKGGRSGELIESAGGPGERRVNSFRHDLPKAAHVQEAWFYTVWLAVILFFFDVFVRRVTIKLDWLRPTLTAARDRLLGRVPQPVPTEYMNRLKSRKAEIGNGLDSRRAAARFEPSSDVVSGGPAAAEPETSQSTQSPVVSPSATVGSLAADNEQISYTDRLLKAKMRVWDERKKHD